MDKIFTKEVKIAIVAIVAIVALFFGMNFLKGLTIFSSTTEYRMQFSDLKGLTKNTAVYADGYKVGTISDIEYNYAKNGDITVIAELDPELRIPAGSTATIEKDLMGNVSVTLLLANNPRERIEAGGIIPGANDNGALKQIQSMIPAIQAMLPKLDSIMGSLNRILADPAITNTLHNAEAVSGDLKVSTAQLNTLLASLNHNVPGMMTKANKVLDNTETLTDKLAAVDVAGTMAQVNQTLSNVKQMTDAITNKQGTVGMLLYDQSLYNNLNNTVRDADSLVVNLKQHPGRYVHFSIFGRKDK